MKVVYFILAGVFIFWWWPYSLIIIIILVIIAVLSVYSSSNNAPTSQASSSQNRTPAKRDIHYSIPKNYIKISRLQSEKIQAVINALMTLEDVDMYKIINRLQHFKHKYFEQNNIYVSDLYDYILRIANERINTAKRDFVKREYEIVIQIITQHMCPVKIRTGYYKV